MPNNKPVTQINLLDFYKGLTSDNRFIHDLAVEFAENSDHTKVIVDGIEKTVFNYFDGVGEITNSKDYFKYCSKEERKTVLNNIDILIAEKTEEQQKLIISQLISSIEFYLNQLEKWQAYPFFHTDLKLLKENLIVKYSYLLGNIKVDANNTTTNPKIQWLGKTNVLATLIFELWQGQEKGKNIPNTLPMIKAQKKELEELLLNNFLDKDGNPLKASTISDYLNSSKPESRAKKGTRIELDY
jgi:hypothetical protein